MSLTKVVSTSSGYLPQLQGSVVNTIEYSQRSSNSLKIFESPKSRSMESVPIENILSAKQILVEEEEKTQIWSDGSIFSGNFQNGHRHGKGEARWPNGEVDLSCYLCTKMESFYACKFDLSSYQYCTNPSLLALCAMFVSMLFTTTKKE